MPCCVFCCGRSGSKGDGVREAVRLAAVLRVQLLVDDRLFVCLDAVDTAHCPREKV